MADRRFAHEKRLHVLARHGQSVRRRWAFVGLGLAIALANGLLDFFPAPWTLSFIPPLTLLAANAWCAWRLRAGRPDAWHFWFMLVADALGLHGMCAIVGEHGTIAIAFNVAIAAGYGLGLPRAARLQLLLSGVLYPIARVLGGARSASGVLLETVCLVALSWLAVAWPMRFTYRLRRARRALGALEQGDFTPRLPTHALDDLGFLAVSFNSTAEALGTIVEELHRSREALAHQAFHDPLTGLANRTRFHERLRRALTGDHAARVAVLMIDLDGFKDVNDRLGHAAGDRLLTMVAERLLDATRGRDTVARIGGDEFAVLLENVDRAPDAEAVAERILGALDEPLEIEGTPVSIGASVGIARHATSQPVGPDDPAEPTDPGDALLRRADLAMYAAKANGKGRHALHDGWKRGNAPERDRATRWMLV